LPSVAGTIPTTVSYHPLLVHDGTPGVGDGGQERTPRLSQGHGDGASGVVSHDGGLDLLTGGNQSGRVSGLHGSTIVSGGAAINNDADVVVTYAEEGLSQHPLRGAVATLQQTTLVGVRHVRSGQLTTIVEGDALADVEGVHGAVVRQLPGLGQLRHELVRALAVVEHQGLIDVEDDRSAGSVVSERGIQGVDVTNGGFHE